MKKSTAGVGRDGDVGVGRSGEKKKQVVRLGACHCFVPSSALEI